jgi:lysyl-tRNA synthetase class 2
MTNREWRPTAALPTLARRAAALAAVRSFFSARGVMEVETPILVAHPVTDPQLANVRARLAIRPGETFYLHTSPEYHMKRLLAAGFPDIYQLGKVFRDGEAGRRHLTEFTLVEWYRRDADYHRFIGETCDLVREIASACGRALSTPTRVSYRDAFLAAAGLDPLEAPVDLMRRRHEAATGAGAPPLGDGADSRAGWLDLLMVTVVEPWLRDRGLIVVDAWPAAQAALARLDPADTRVARRFEVYLDGLELANGFEELTDAVEQRRRFEADCRQRKSAGLDDASIDEAFLAALAHGLPACCGVAVGFDRVLMASLGAGSIAEVVSFPEI